MGYGTDGLTFRTLRDANLQRLPLFKDAKGRTCHGEKDGSDVVKPPKVLYVSFDKEGGQRCCSFDTMKELREAHPADRYDVVEYVEYVPRKNETVRKRVSR
jgi:hypothetical protein